jgi:hypothetical protein
VQRTGRFDVLASSERGMPAPLASPVPHALPFDEAVRLSGRGGSLATRLGALRGLAVHPAGATAGTLLRAAGDLDALVRRAALTSLLTAITRDAERGLEAYVAAEGLDRRTRILVLRTVRDLRDPRAASYLFAEAASGDSRIVRDALGAMKVTRAQTVARMRLWAGAEEPKAWPGRTALLAAVRRTLADEAAPAEAAAFAAELAGLLPDPEAVGLLRRRFRDGMPGTDGARPLGDATTTASAAGALVRLAPSDDLACELTRVLARLDASIAEIVPSALVDLAARNAAGRTVVADCLRSAVVNGVESAIWVAAALGASQLSPELCTVLASGTPEVRRAAAWTLGELAGDADVVEALRTAADRDPDDVVARLAAGAHRKQTGAMPRSLAPAIGIGAFSDRGAAG